MLKLSGERQRVRVEHASSVILAIYGEVSETVVFGAEGSLTCVEESPAFRPG